MGEVGGGGDHDPHQLAGVARTNPSAADSKEEDDVDRSPDTRSFPRASCRLVRRPFGSTKNHGSVLWKVPAVLETRARTSRMLRNRCPVVRSAQWWGPTAVVRVETPEARTCCVAQQFPTQGLQRLRQK